MVLGMIARLSSNICCFLYPAYASYKALSVSPDSSPEAMSQVERWLMYWAVVGTWTAIESVVGWSFTWLPFYSVVKALVFIYLASPQSEGTSYIYRTQLAPFFHEHERDIDMFLASLRGRASTAIAGGVGWAWNKAKTQLNVPIPVGQGDGTGQYPVGGPGGAQPPTLQDPASGPALQLYGYLSKYAGQYMPVALSALAAATSRSGGSSTSRSRARDDRDSTPLASQNPDGVGPSMPIPRVNSNSGDAPNCSIRSRTFQHANAPVDQSGFNQSGPLPTPPSFFGQSGPQPQQGNPGPSQGWYGSNPNSNSTSASASPHRSGLQLPSYPSGPGSRGSGSGSGAGSQGTGDWLSAHSSEESLGTRSSGSTSATRFGVGGEGYEHVNRDEISDPGVRGQGQGQGQGQGGGLGTPQRPGLGAGEGDGGKRRSSWFGWGGSGSGSGGGSNTPTPTRSKVE